MKIEVYSKDFSKDVAAAYVPHAFPLPKLPCKAAIEFSGEVEDADYNLLRDRLIETLRGSGAAQKLIDALVETTREYDDEIGRAVAEEDATRATNLFDLYFKRTRALLDKFEDAVAKLFGDAWVGFVKNRAMYKDYKLKIAVDVAVATTTLAGGVATLLATPTPIAPVALALGCYNIFKSAAKLAVTARNALVEAETVAAGLRKEGDVMKQKLEKLARLEAEARQKDEAAKRSRENVQREAMALEKEAKDAKKKAEAEKKLAKAKEKLKELAASFMNKISGDLVGVKAATVQGYMSKCVLYCNKIRGIEENTRALAKEYLDSFSKTAGLGKYIEELDERLELQECTLAYSAKAKAEIAKTRKKLETAKTAFKGMQESFAHLHEDVQASEKRYHDNVENSKELAETAKKAVATFQTGRWAEAGRWLGVAGDLAVILGPAGPAAFATTEKATLTGLKMLQIFEREAIVELKKK